MLNDMYTIKDAETGTIKAVAYLMEMSSSQVMLNRIELTRGTDPRNNWGAKLLKVICEEADRKKVELILGVSPDDMNYFNSLTFWYKGFGFKPIEDFSMENNIMTREPKEV